MERKMTNDEELAEELKMGKSQKMTFDSAFSTALVHVLSFSNIF